jgi:cytochrome c5
MNTLISRTSLLARRKGGSLLAALLGVPAIAFAAAAPDRTGKEVVEAVCITCHGPGTDKAPRIGNTAEWSSHAAQGLQAMTRNAITGIRKMPAHGGQGSLTDLEVTRAVTYMVSGGKTADPDKAYSSPKQISGENLVKAHCHNCHAEGKDGAPHIGNMADWQPRLQKGVDSLVQSAVRGHKAMPARSGMNHLSDADLKAAVTYMVTQVSAAPKK